VPSPHRQDAGRRTAGRFGAPQARLEEAEKVVAEAKEAGPRAAAEAESGTEEGDG